MLSALCVPTAALLGEGQKILSGRGSPPGVCVPTAAARLPSRDKQDLLELFAKEPRSGGQRTAGNPLREDPLWGKEDLLELFAEEPRSGGQRTAGCALRAGS